MAQTSGGRDDLSLRDAMDRYASGDTAAFELVYDGLAPRLRAMLQRQGCPPSSVEDVVQQTFLQLHVARAHYRKGQDVAPWAFAIARRLRIDAWRRSQREKRQVLRTPEEPPDPEHALVAGETARQLAHGLAALPDPQREAFSLVKLEGLSLRQTAAVLDTSVTAIKLRIHRAYQLLRGATQVTK